MFAPCVPYPRVHPLSVHARKCLRIKKIQKMCIQSTPINRDEQKQVFLSVVLTLIPGTARRLEEFYPRSSCTYEYNEDSLPRCCMAITMDWTPSRVLESTISSNIAIMLSPPSKPNRFSAGHFVAKYFSKLTEKVEIIYCSRRLASRQSRKRQSELARRRRR